ncbi:MAG TPA: BolA family protein [Nevskiaceae bacterium]|nr:BolA family protein [Nevskiaceae bacterium]
MSADRLARMRAALLAAMPDAQIELIDDSAAHAGHAGAASGRGHYRVQIVSQDFSGRKPIERHRLVYDALGAMMQTDIHALSISARTPGET